MNYTLKAGIVGIRLGLPNREIAIGMCTLGNKIMDEDISPTIYQRYLVHRVFASHESRILFLNRFLWFYITEFFGTSEKILLHDDSFSSDMSDNPTRFSDMNDNLGDVVINSDNHINNENKVILKNKSNYNLDTDIYKLWSNLEYPSNILSDCVYIELQLSELSLDTLESWCFKLEHNLPWKSWKTLLNSIGLMTPSSIVNFSPITKKHISQLSGLNQDELDIWLSTTSKSISSFSSSSGSSSSVSSPSSNELFKLYYAGNRNIENIALSLLETSFTKSQIIKGESVFIRWCQLFFKRQGLELPVDGSYKSSKSNNLFFKLFDYPILDYIPEELVNSDELNISEEDKNILKLLPKSPNYFQYTSEFISYMTTKIWAHRVLCWIEWTLLRISTLKHRTKILECIDIQVLEFISERSLEDLIIESPPEYFSSNQEYCWKLLLHDISIGLINRVMRFKTHYSIIETTGWTWLNKIQMKKWYRLDQTYFTLTLLKACPPSSGRINPNIIRESMEAYIIS